VLQRRGSNFHLAAVEAIAARDAKAARNAIVGDIQAAGQYLLGLADSAGIIRPPETQLAP
jgi:DNA-binding GntR family transcriptional regulator